MAGPVQVIQGVAAPLLRDNVDTDAIIPSREITSPSREGFGTKLFGPWRYRGLDGAEDPSFILNQEPWRQACILIAGSNFGCGSSREMAVWALWQFGIRCVIAPSFGAIFRDNCIRNGLLPVELPAALVAGLAQAAAQVPGGWTVDLQRCEVLDPQRVAHSFVIDPHERESLLSGLDAIDLTWQLRPAIEAFEAADRQRRPWIWAAPERPSQPP